MTTAVFEFLNHRIHISLPDPDDSNEIYVEIYRKAGTFNPDLYNAYRTHYQFSADSNDPNDWVVEGVKSALIELAGYGEKFHESRAKVEPTAQDYEDIPF